MPMTRQGRTASSVAGRAVAMMVRHILPPVDLVRVETSVVSGVLVVVRGLDLRGRGELQRLLRRYSTMPWPIDVVDEAHAS